MPRPVAIVLTTLLLVLLAPWPATAQVCNPSDPACGLPRIIAGSGNPFACVAHVCATANVNASGRSHNGTPEVDRGQSGAYEIIVRSHSNNTTANITIDVQTNLTGIEWINATSGNYTVEPNASFLLSWPFRVTDAAALGDTPIGFDLTEGNETSSNEAAVYVGTAPTNATTMTTTTTSPPAPAESRTIPSPAVIAIVAVAAIASVLRRR